MFETVINLKPRSEWREGVNLEELTREMNEALAMPGVANAFTMPIKARIDMLSTGIRTPLGIQDPSSDLSEIEKIGVDLERRIREVPGVRSVYAERVNTAILPRHQREEKEASRYNLTVDDVNSVIQALRGVGSTCRLPSKGEGATRLTSATSGSCGGELEDISRVLVPVAAEGSPGDVPGAATGIRPGPLEPLPPRSETLRSKRRKPWGERRKGGQ